MCARRRVQNASHTESLFAIDLEATATLGGSRAAAAFVLHFSRQQCSRASEPSRFSENKVKAAGKMAGAFKHSLPFHLTQRGLRLSRKISQIANFNVSQTSSSMPGQMDEAARGRRATFGMGCFWAGDSLYGATPGVIRTSVGYAGGTKDNPAYRDMGDHTEVIDIEYNPEKISFSQLLDLFWNNHEYGLTTRIKRQYMSLILYHDDEQRIAAEKSRDRLQREKNETFTTEISEFKKFYPAEDYHQKYRLQGHPWLVEAIGVKKAEQLRTSPLAAKLNGYLAGVVTVDEYDRDVAGLGLSDKAVQYVRKHVIERQGNGLYC